MSATLKTEDLKVGDRIKLLDPSEHAPMVGFSYMTEKKMEAYIGTTQTLDTINIGKFCCGQPYLKIEELYWPLLAVKKLPQRKTKRNA